MAVNEFAKAKNYSFLLLKMRMRSESEIAERLKMKEYSPEVVTKTLEYLREKNLINDNEFAKTWIEERKRKSLGLRKIANELRSKGIKNQVIESQIGSAKHSYNETEMIRKIAEKKLDKLKDVDREIASSRVYAYLLRRGFPEQVVTDTIEGLIH